MPPIEITQKIINSYRKVKGFHKDALDNQEKRIKKLQRLRHEKSKQLLGVYKPMRHFVLEERMAETPLKRYKIFKNELLAKAKTPQSP